MMCRTNLIRRVLEVLANNIETNIHPHLVESSRIAKELNLEIPKTKKLLKAMHDMGVIVRSVETDHSLITWKGLNSASAV